MPTQETIFIDTNTDTDLLFHINNFESLAGYVLKMEIRGEEPINGVRPLVGAFIMNIESPTSFRATLPHTVSGTIPEGEYLTDVLAIGARRVYITPVLKVIVTSRITLPG